jgi:protein-export membrane protein SecD
MLNFRPWKISLIVAILLLGVITALPNLFTRDQLAAMPNWLPKQQVTLGLDLQGGSHLLLEVDVKAVIDEQLNGVVDSVRTAFRKANIGYSDLGVKGNAVGLKLRDTGQIEEARKLLKDAAPGLDQSVADDGAVTLTLNDQAILERQRNAVAQSIEIVRRRIDETGTKEPTIQRQGTDRILVQLPGVKDPEHIKALIGKTAKMTFRFVDTTVSVDQARAGNLPPTSEILPSAQNGGDGQPMAYYVVQKRVMVSGENLIDAQATFQDAQPVVSFRFDSLGAKRFGDATRENVGKLFAIVLDGKVISAPVIRDAITSGSGVISGSFTTQSANDLALLLRAGALPAPLTVIEERTVGADLGADSIAAGKFACMIGLVLIVLAMLLLYGLFGVFANIALVLNAILLLGALSILGATLTLPGIAGIALTLGMAIDANVLIFERIREEVRNGRSPIASLDHGFSEARRTIIDANVTHLISSLILFMLGSGPVKGFAVTLSFGVLTTMFTSVMVTRLIVVLWYSRMRPAALPI